MIKYEREIPIKQGVTFKLKTVDHGNEVWTYGKVCYCNGKQIPFKHVVTKSSNYKSYYVWTDEHIYIRSNLGTIDRIIFDIDNQKEKKIYISPSQRHLTFGKIYEGNNKSINFDYEIKLNEEATLLIDRFWNGSDLCESANIFYKDKSVINLKPVIICSPADYEVPEYYVWDNDYVYICFDGVDNEVKVKSIFDVSKRKIVEEIENKSNDHMLLLLDKNKKCRN